MSPTKRNNASKDGTDQWKAKQREEKQKENKPADAREVTVTHR